MENTVDTMVNKNRTHKRENLDCALRVSLPHVHTIIHTHTHMNARTRVRVCMRERYCMCTSTYGQCSRETIHIKTSLLKC